MPTSRVRANFRVQAQLYGDYRKLVIADGPAGFWRMGEFMSYSQSVTMDFPAGFWKLNAASGTTELDRSGNGRNGTINGGPSLNQIGAIANGDTAILFDGVNDYITMGDLAAFEFTGAFSVEFWCKYTSVSNFFVSKSLSTAAGWFVGTTAGNAIQFYAGTNTGAPVFNVTTSLAYNNGAYHHVVCTWDGTTGANQVKIYVDGVQVAQGTAGAGAIDTNAAPFLIGAWHTTPTGFFAGTLDDVAVFGYRLSALAVANRYALRLSTLTDTLTLRAADEVTNGGAGPNQGTYNTGVTVQQLTNQPDTDRGALFDGVNSYVNIPHSTSITPTGPFTVEAWVKSTNVAFPIVDKYGPENTYDGFLFHVGSITNGKVSLWTGQSWVTGSRSVNDGLLHHVVGVWTGSVVRIFVDGLLDVSAAPGVAARLGGTHDMQIGRRYDTSEFAAATIDDVALYLYALSDAQVLAHAVSGAGWTDLTRDVLAVESGIRAFRGTNDVGPMARVDEPGLMEFSLRNDKNNTGKKRSWYSPNHTNCRPGWKQKIPVRLVATFNGVDYQLWYGKTRTIDPTPGDFPQRVLVTAQNIFADLTETTIRELNTQTTKTEKNMARQVLLVLPLDSQLLRGATGDDRGMSWDVPVDFLGIAFDNIGDGTSALSLIDDVMVSVFGTFTVRGSGVIRYINRHTESTADSQLTLLDTDLLAGGPGYRGPSSLASVFNMVRVTIHPKTIVPNTVLFRAQTSEEPLQPGLSRTVWDTYSDPNSRDRLIGGDNFTALVATTDYTANTLSDGSGADRTANLSISITPFAGTAKSVLTNTGTDQLFVTMRQLRGDGFFDNSPSTFQSPVNVSGDRPLDVDLPYQNSSIVTQDLADYLLAQWSDPRRQGEELIWDPQRSSTLMLKALTLEVGDVVTASERQTGLNAVEFLIRGIEYNISLGPGGYFLTMRYAVVPHVMTSVFVFDHAVTGVFDGAQSLFGYA